MTPAKPALEAPDYGLDAPGVVRNLLLAGAAGLLLWTLGALGVIAKSLTFHVGGNEVRLVLSGIELSLGLALTATGLWMIWSSKLGKVREREKLLDRLAWRGDERVLDVGCGRGLMLIGSAKRLTTGTATGIDIWQAEDLTGNRPEATLDNARLEGSGR